VKDFKPFNVGPAHRYLDRPQTKFLGDHEVFNVEAEAILFLPRKDGLGRLRAVELESTLRVVEGQACEGAHHNIEEPPGILAERGLMHRH
jgi:hypothetical protein